MTGEVGKSISEEVWDITRRADRNSVEIRFMGKMIDVYPEQADVLQGLAFWYEAVRQAQKPTVIQLQMNDADRKILLKLCHPDKHNGDKQAEEMFKKLNY